MLRQGQCINRKGLKIVTKARALKKVHVSSYFVKSGLFNTCLRLIHAQYLATE